MHSLGARGRLFAASVGVVVVVVAVSGVLAEREIRALMLQRIEGELLADARAAATLVEEVSLRSSNIDSLDAATIDPPIDGLGRAVGARITVIANDGAVRADSELTLEQVASAESHADRPEIAAARRTGRGVATRYSNTLGTDMLYVATRIGPELTTSGAATLHGVVRAAMPLHDIDAAISRMRGLLAVAGILGLGIALVMSALASQLLSRALRELVAEAKRSAGAQVPEGTPDEVDALAGTFARLRADLRAAVSTLSTERDRSKAVLEAMQDSVIAVDADARVLFLNDAARMAFAVVGDPNGRLLLEVVRVPQLEAAVAEARAGRDHAVEVNVPGEVPRVIEARATPTRLSGGAVLVLRDVTNVRRLETMRRDFVANVSHELRTPISVIAANAETLLDGALEDPERASGFVEGIGRNAQRLARLIADLLDIAAIESGRVDLTLEPLSLQGAAERVLDALRPRAAEKRQSFELTIAADAGLLVLADAKALDQILSNLVDNAIKYTPKGSSIAVRAAPDADGRVRLLVEDDGPGISPEHRARLFERFYRVDPGRSREMGGTGLGLAIVKHLVEAMGGEVTAQAREPAGARFVVLLPSPPANAPPSRPPSSS